MAHSFIAYIDESGDDGLEKFRVAGKRGGSSTWLNVSCLVTRHTHNLDVVGWRDQISALSPQRKGKAVHYMDLNHGQRVAAAQILSKLPIRSCNVISNKGTIPAGTYDEKNQLYFYLTRYLIERLSWLCRDMRPSVPEGDGLVQIVFSRRGGMSIVDFKEYLNRLKNEGDDDIRIHWPVIDIEGILAFDHSVNAGLQLADINTSAIASGLEPDLYGNCESRYAEILKPIVYCRRGNYYSYGMKVVPKISEMELSEQQARTLKLFE